MNNIGVTGANGKLGTRLVNAGCVPLYCDIRSPGEIALELADKRPDGIIHLAALTSVDACEKDYRQAVDVNVFGTKTLCEIAEKVLGEGRVAIVSSDQVFGGGEGMYTENDEPSPINIYGLTKFAAEGVVIAFGGKVIRISRCFSGESNDIREYLDALERNEIIHVPDFFYRSYCHLDFMTEMLYRYADHFAAMPKTLHLAGLGAISFFGLMTKIADEFGYDTDLVFPRGEEEGYVARPYKCGLDTSLAAHLGFPQYPIEASIRKMKYEDKYASV
jgi:dTDP-4-dehydrorhamnose reductase